MVRVISGSARGMKLVSPSGLDTRPTLDRVKEPLFSMLMPYIRGAKVLDLFAGSGALGIEALSRGAESAVFVDNSKEAQSCVKQNLEKARLLGAGRFVLGDSLRYLRESEGGFSLIFLDPPYNGGLYEKALGLIYERKLLTEGGRIAVEWDSGVGEPEFPPCYVRERDRRYGRVCLTILCGS